MEMRRHRPFPRCERIAIPRRLRDQIVLRQQGRCADCGALLDLAALVIDHRPPLALRAADEQANDPDRMAAICRSCDRRKTSRDLRTIAKTKRVAIDEQAHQSRLSAKVCGRPRLSKRAERALVDLLNQHAPDHGTVDDGTNEGTDDKAPS